MFPLNVALQFMNIWLEMDDSVNNVCVGVHCPVHLLCWHVANRACLHLIHALSISSWSFAFVVHAQCFRVTFEELTCQLELVCATVTRSIGISRISALITVCWPDLSTIEPLVNLWSISTWLEQLPPPWLVCARCISVLFEWQWFCSWISRRPRSSNMLALSVHCLHP